MRIPVGIITIWHPEVFGHANMVIQELEKYPKIIKDRRQQEALKEKISKEKGLSISKKVMHDRVINNLGISNDNFRNTWISGKSIKGIISEYELRLIGTENEESQSRFKLEARPNWGSEPNVLPEELSNRIKDNIARTEKICIRQLWINPLNIDEDSVCSNNLYYSEKSLVNFVVGPYFHKCIRKNKCIRFEKNKECVDMVQHRPSYINQENNCIEQINILPERKFWWANISKK